MADLPPALQAPPPQVTYIRDASGRQIPVGHSGTPGFSGAILDAIRAIAQQVAPRGLVQRPQAVQGAIAQGEGGLGDQLAPPQ